MLCCILARYIKPMTVVETGVAYGITTGLVLLAMAQNNLGRFNSIELPSLSDHSGPCIGMASPKRLGS